MRIPPALLLLACLALGACTQPDSLRQQNLLLGDANVLPQTLDRLEKGKPHSIAFGISIDPTCPDGEGQTLHYFIAEDGKSVVTRYLGPGGPSGVSLRFRNEQVDDWHLLLCKVEWMTSEVVLAKWKIDGSGQAMETHVRTAQLRNATNHSN
jgi:hypothetical protein